MTKPFKHQTDVIERFKNKKYGAILLEMGLGKTFIAIKLAEHQYTTFQITAVLICMPKSLLSNWSKIEIPAHSELEYECIVWGGKNNPAFKTGKIQYFLVNHDAILTERFIAEFKTFIKIHKKFMLVAEESTAFKSSKAKRTKRIISIASMAESKYILSGAPVVQSPMDAFSQFEILGPHALGYKSIVTFRNRYAETTRMTFGMRSFDKITGYRNLDELTNSIKSLGVIIKKEDVLDLPPIMLRKMPVELTADQQIAYDDLKSRALAYIQGNEINVTNAIALLNKLLQICSGQLKFENKYLDITTDRLDTLQELVEECAGKTVIWSAFVRSGEAIAQKLGNDVVRVPAGLPPEQRHTLLETFRHGSKKALVMNPASGGMGITLIESSNVIYYDRSFNYEHRIQSLARNHRIGQTSSVLVTDLYAPGTIEESVIKALNSKEIMANTVITSDWIREILK